MDDPRGGGTVWAGARSTSSLDEADDRLRRSEDAHRTSLRGSPAEAVTGGSAGRSRRSRPGYLMRHIPDDVDVRFDVVAIVSAPGAVTRCDHIEDAWRPDPPARCEGPPAERQTVDRGRRQRRGQLAPDRPRDLVDLDHHLRELLGVERLSPIRHRVAADRVDLDDQTRQRTAATAARPIGITFERRPVPWLGSAMIGR